MVPAMRDQTKAPCDQVSVQAGGKIKRRVGWQQPHMQGDDGFHMQKVRWTPDDHLVHRTASAGSQRSPGPITAFVESQLTLP